MPKYTNSFDTQTAKGNREELSDFIGRVDQNQQSFLALLKTKKTSNPLFSFQIDSISTGTPTPREEGFTFDPQASTATTPLMNVTSILSKNAVVTRNQLRTDSAGRGNELSYQIDKRSTELKNECEKLFLDKQGMTNGATRITRGLVSFLDANPASKRVGTGPAAGAYDATTAVVDAAAGSRISFTESVLLDVLQALFASGARPDTIMVPPYLARKLGNFPGRAANQVIIKDQTVSRGARTYDCEFGLLDVVMNYNMRTSDALVLTSGTIAKRVIDWFAVRTPATAFDGEAREIVVDAGLEVSVPQANAVIRDLKADAASDV